MTMKTISPMRYIHNRGVISFTRFKDLHVTKIFHNRQTGSDLGQLTVVLKLETLNVSVLIAKASQTKSKLLENVSLNDCFQHLRQAFIKNQCS